MAYRWVNKTKTTTKFRAQGQDQTFNYLHPMKTKYDLWDEG